MKRTLNWDTYPLVLTPEETAMLLNCTIATVQKLCRKGELPGYKLAGRKWRIPRDKLRAVLEKEAG